MLKQYFLLLLTLLLIGCRETKTPENDPFVGSYTGTLYYTDVYPNDPANNASGTVTDYRYIYHNKDGYYTQSECTPFFNDTLVISDSCENGAILTYEFYQLDTAKLWLHRNVWVRDAFGVVTATSTLSGTLTREP